MEEKISEKLYANFREKSVPPHIKKLTRMIYFEALGDCVGYIISYLSKMKDANDTGAFAERFIQLSHELEDYFNQLAKEIEEKEKNEARKNQ